MFSSDAYLIRAALPDDESLLLRLSVLDSQGPIAHPALIGEIDGAPAAAIELDTGRVVADPFASTAALAAHLRLRALMVRSRKRRRPLFGGARQPRWA
jgi:hypothetical protein